MTLENYERLTKLVLDTLKDGAWIAAQEEEDDGRDSSDESED